MNFSLNPMDYLNKHNSVFENPLQAKTHLEPSCDPLKKAADDLIEALSTGSDFDFTRNPGICACIDRLFEKEEIQSDFGHEKRYNYNDPQERQPLLSNLKRRFQPQEQETKVSDLTEGAENKIDDADTPSVSSVEASSTYKDVHLAKAFLDMQIKACEIQEKRIATMLKEIEDLNEHNKSLSLLINGLARCKESGKADFTSDKEMCAVIDRVFAAHPKMFGQKTYVWSSEKMMDNTIAAGNAASNHTAAQITQINMRLQFRLEENLQTTKHAKELLDQWMGLMRTVIGNSHPKG